MATDHSAVVDINGTLTSEGFSCSVMPSESSVSLLELPETLIKQGDNATAPVIVHVSVMGDDRCSTLVDDGKIAFRFSGNADNADGTALANSLTDETAAKGVAIGIFDGDNKPVKVKTGRLPVKTDTVFGLQMVQLKGQEAVAGNINTAVTIEIERL
ncbi:Fimbrial protein [compost metagenome]